MARTQEISIAAWRQLCEEGAAPAVRIPLHGVSMQPLVRKDRDLVTVVPLHRPLKKGDIVLFFRKDGQYVVHRLKFIRGNTVQTLGDGCAAPDAPMPLSAICGLITQVEREGRVYRQDTSFARLLGRGWMASLPLRKFARRAIRKIRRCLHG